MRELTPQETDLVLRYVEGDLAGEELSAFEATLSTDAALRAEVDRFQRIDDRVRAALPVPQAPSEPLNFERVSKQASTAQSRWLKLGLAAAVILAAGLGGQFGLGRYLAWAGRLDAGNLYRVTTIRFEPQVICDTPEKFADYTDKIFGVPITPRGSESVHLVGWRSPLAGYDPEKDPDAEGPRLLLVSARDDAGQPAQVIVLFQDASAWAPELAEDSGLRLFSRKIGGVRMYEVTPLDEPVALDLLERGHP